MPKTAQKTLVVFDIDGTLTPDNAIYNEDATYSFIREFESRRMLIHIENFLYLLPIGSIELIQLIDEHPEIELAFFSAGLNWRNERFVKELLSLALGPARYQELKPTLKIISRDQLTWGEQAGLGKKDLSLFGHDLEHLVIIDDNLDVFHQEHIQNVLSITPITLHSFYTIHGSFIDQKKSIYSWESFIDETHLDEHFASMNQLFYVTGLLFTALQRANHQQITLRQALTDIQFKESGAIYHDLAKEPDFYYHGLNILRQKNPMIFFIDDMDFLADYFPKIPEKTAFDELLKIIDNYTLSTPKIKHGFFTGQLPRNLREIKKQVAMMQNEDISHQEGLFNIIEMTEKMGKYRPILKAAKAYHTFLHKLDGLYTYEFSIF